MNETEIKELRNATIDGIRDAQELCHTMAKKAGWEIDIHTGAKLEVDVIKQLFLIGSEVFEAGDAYRKDLKSTKIDVPGLEEELADVLIRTLDLCGKLNIDIAQVVVDKLKYNETRADHKIANRLKTNGKKF